MLAGGLEREDAEGIQRLQRRIRAQGGRLRERPLHGFSGSTLLHGRLHAAQLPADGLEPLLGAQGALQGAFLSGGAFFDGGGQIVQQLAGGAAAVDAPAFAEARQEKFVGIVGVARLRAHKRRKSGILHRRLPPLTERAAQADVPLEHPRRAAAGQLVDAGIGLGQRPEQCLRVGRGRRLGLFLRGRVGQDVRQGLGPELRRGVLGLRRGGGRLFCLRLLRLLRQGEDHDRGQPRRGEHAARDQAVACDGKAEQDQKKADDDAFDGTHGGSSFRCAAAGTSRGSRAAPRRACRRRARRYSRGPDKNAGR